MKKIENLKFLTREDILAADDIKRKTIAVPEWGGKLTIKTMTGSERDAMEFAAINARQAREAKAAKAAEAAIAAGQPAPVPDQDEAKDNVRANLASATIVDEQGNRIFSYEDVEKLGQKSSAALQRVYEAALELNKVSQADIDELVGNSEAAPSDVSGTNSQDT